MGVTPNRKVLPNNENIFNSEYLRRLRDHDPSIEAHFYSYFEPKLKLKLTRRRLQDSDVRDIIQDTFMRTLKAVRDNTIKSPNTFGGYVSSVCDFVLYEKYRDRSRLHLDLDSIDVVDEEENLEQRVYEKERRKKAETALGDLRVEDRNLLRAKLFDELDNEEICARLGISPDKLRVTLHRATKRFAKACRKRGLDLEPGYSGNERPTFELAKADSATLLERYHELIDQRLTGALSQEEERELLEIEESLEITEDAQTSVTQAAIEEHHRMLMQQLSDLAAELRRFSSGGQQQSEVQ
jgi:RNA polymerase sigma factor (sigma-70 family)